MSGPSSDFLDLSGVNPPSGKAAALDPQHFSVLEGMSPVHLRILNEASRVMYVSKGVELLHEGDTPHGLYFIDSGKLTIAKRVADKQKILSQMGPGNVYGEFGVLRKKSRYASVFTAEPSRIIRVDISAIHQVLEVDAGFRKRLNDLLTRRMLSSFFFSHPVFQGLPQETCQAVGKDIPMQFMERGSRIFTQGDQPTGIYLILSGEVEVRYLNRSKAEVLLEIRRDNDLIGEVVQKNGTALAYSAVSSSDVDLLVLNKDTMNTLQQHYPQVYTILENYINKRSEQTVKRLKENLA
ncbi:MAG TPA: cyclic nucleotide-binding domain-containing protein [Mariprofundaceae bacterium]|nr:cyclic nucleotide-binding domain-containing protein [Mariprofundaceae bacterium]